jgi:hypothetical protein
MKRGCKFAISGACVSENQAPAASSGLYEMHAKLASTLRASVLCCMISIGLHGPGLPPVGLVFTDRALRT